MARFTPSIKSENDFHNGVEWRNLIDGLSASDLNNIVEGLLYALQNGGTKLYRHDIELIGEYYAYIADFYITLYNADPNDYSVPSVEDEYGEPIPLSINQIPFIPTHYIVCNGAWGTSVGSGAENIALKIKRTDTGVLVVAVSADEYGSLTTYENIDISQFDEIKDVVTEVTV